MINISPSARLPGSQFHALFDREADTSIGFPEETVMGRKPSEPGELQITMPVSCRAVIRLIPHYYTKVLGLPFYVRFDDRVFQSAPMAWSSWTSYYEDVTENDVIRNTDWPRRKPETVRVSARSVGRRLRSWRPGTALLD
jgi:hypothetical protein